MSKPDQELIADCLAGQTHAFGDLVVRYQNRLYNTLATVLGSADDAHDVAQEAFVNAFQKLHTFRGRSAFYSWLFRIASNLIADRAKRKAKISATSEEVELIPQDSRKDSQSGLEDVERQAQLFRLVNGLPEDQRRVVALRFAEDKSIKEISNELGRSEGAVKQLQFRALENLRKRFTTEDTEEYKS